ncbi:MAG TPA: hypothetical protein PLZ05_01410 [Alphaproteobacteria bacterium]|nr:hypothetical protein [Alphaproteobacteria bacterium]
MVQKTTKSKLLSWLFSEPVRFAIISFLSVLGVSFVYILAREIFYKDMVMSSIPFLILIFFVILINTVLLIKRLPKDILDRRSFIAIDNGLSIIYFSIFIIMTLFIASSARDLVFYTIWLQNYSMVFFLLTATLGSLVYLYVIGLMISNIYVIFRRAVSMGVPKWKIILSMPFMFSMFWVSNYLLPEDKKTKSSIDIKTKWYSRFTDWVISKPINTMIVFLIVTILSGLFFDTYSSTLTILFALVFGVWVWATGLNKFQKSIGGTFSTFVWIMNIAIILTFTGFLLFSPKTANVSMQYETVQITDNVKK